MKGVHSIRESRAIRENLIYFERTMKTFFDYFSDEIYKFSQITRDALFCRSLKPVLKNCFTDWDNLSSTKRISEGMRQNRFARIHHGLTIPKWLKKTFNIFRHFYFHTSTHLYLFKVFFTIILLLCNRLTHNWLLQLATASTNNLYSTTHPGGDTPQKRDNGIVNVLH